VLSTAGGAQPKARYFLGFQSAAFTSVTPSFFISAKNLSASASQPATGEVASARTQMSDLARPLGHAESKSRVVKLTQWLLAWREQGRLVSPWVALG
jgi:hypothetical protein